MLIFCMTINTADLNFAVADEYCFDSRCHVKKEIFL
jgi:hypothetical protein